MPNNDTSQDYLTHYFDIPRYQWLFALSIGTFIIITLFIQRRLIPPGTLRRPILTPVIIIRCLASNRWLDIGVQAKQVGRVEATLDLHQPVVIDAIVTLGFA